jgi:methionine synthase I (cobalamin-dependent)
MGTELLRHGVRPAACLELASVEQPALVTAIHRAYRDAGAEVLTTNTFGANRFRLAPHGLEHRVDELNRAAASLARSVAAEGGVVGSIGPSGEQATGPPADELRAAFREQASALAAGGVDLFLCETFGDVSELKTAILGIRDVSTLPILVTMTYRDDGRTPLGLTARSVVELLDDLDIAGIGVNCCTGDNTVGEVLGALGRSTSLPLVARPNAGQPVRVASAVQYPLGPGAFAELVMRWSPRVWMVGGCCGTTPAHIAAVRDLMGDFKAG